MKDRIEAPEFDEKKFKNLIINCYKKEKRPLSLAEIVVKTGMQNDWAAYSLRLLMNDYPCEVRIDGTKTAVYDFNFSNPYGVWSLRKQKLLNKLTHMLEWVWFAAIVVVYSASVFVLSLTFSLLYLFNYPGIFLLKLILSPFANLKKAEDKLFDSLSDFLGALIGRRLANTDLFSWEQLKTTLWPEKKDRLEAEKTLLEFATSNKGRIGKADVIQLLGCDDYTAGIELTKMAGLYGGNIEVSSRGLVVFVFETYTNQEKPDTAHIPRIWHSQKPIKQLAPLSGKDFNLMLLRWLFVTIGLISFLTFVAVLLFLKKPQEYWRLLLYALSPLILLLLSFVLMGFRYVVYSLQNRQIRRRNVRYELIEYVTKNKGLIDASELEPLFKPLKTEKVLNEWKAELHIDEQTGKKMYFLEEFAYSDSLVPERFTKIIIDEGFGQGNLRRWSIGNDSVRTLQVKNNAYCFEHKRPQGSWTTYVGTNLDTSKDYVKIEAVMSFLEGSPENYYGLLWNVQGKPFEYFDFVINAKGCFSGGEFRENTFFQTVPETFLPQIQGEFGKNNCLTVIKQHGQWELYVNQVWAAHWPANNNFKNSSVGFIVYGQSQISITHLYIEETRR